jgi:hypothetical protein
LLDYVFEPCQTELRNFNVCPHCERNGEEALLSRLSEGMPMISRSDGRNFHLLLADRPLAYPMERGEDPRPLTSVCFWYVYGEEGATKTTVVLFEPCAGSREKIFRKIEFIADVLAAELLRRQELGVFYDLQENEIRQLTY